MAIGDIFTMSSSYSLAHSISKDCKLSRGIARMFKSNFGRVDEIRDQKTDTGGVAILDLGQRVIYNLVTKERDPDKSIYDSISRALKAMQRDAIERNVKKIAMPRIGCGPDWLEWEQVKDILVSVFKDTDIEITVCTLRGNGQRGSKLADRTRKGEERKSESTTAKKKKAESSEPKVRPWGMKDAATGQTDPQSQGGGEFPMQEDTTTGRKTKTTRTQQFTAQDQTDRGETSHHGKKSLDYRKTNSGAKDGDPGQADSQSTEDGKPITQENNANFRDKANMDKAEPHTNRRGDMAGKTQVSNYLKKARLDEMNNIVQEISSGKTADQSSDNSRGEDKIDKKTNPQNLKNEKIAIQEENTVMTQVPAKTTSSSCKLIRVNETTRTQTETNQLIKRKHPNIERRPEREEININRAGLNVGHTINRVGKDHANNHPKIGLGKTPRTAHDMARTADTLRNQGDNTKVLSRFLDPQGTGWGLCFATPHLIFLRGHLKKMRNFSDVTKKLSGWPYFHPHLSLICEKRGLYHENQLEKLVLMRPT